MLLKGKPVADAINLRSKDLCDELKRKALKPCLAIFRIGEKDSDLSYERGILKRCDEVGVKAIINVFKQDVSTEEFYEALDKANSDDNIHGILVFRPLPERFDDDQLRNHINPDKDIDGCSDMSLASIFVNKKTGFAPCTAQAVIEILDHYQIDISGKNVVVIGRSLVIGKPVAALLLNRNATVTVCHSKTENIKEIASKADILICASGKMESINAEYTNSKQSVIDVGISWNEKKQKLCGDVDFDDVNDKVENITPVPRGVGSVTSSVLINHVVEACYRKGQ